MAKKRAQEEELEIHYLLRRWPKLPRRSQEAILVLAGVMNARHAERSLDVRKRARPGETPAWYVLALRLLSDSEGFLSDREIARRLGVSNSTLVRHNGYRVARETYLQRTRKIVRAKKRR